MAERQRRSRRNKQQGQRRPQIAWLNHTMSDMTSPLPPTEWASPDQLETIHNASMRILEEIGMAFMDAEALSLWEQAGAQVDHKNEMVRIDRGLLMELVGRAPSTFTWHARNPAYNLTVGGNHINFAPNTGMPFVTDLERGRRDGTLADFENFAKLAHTIPYFHIAGAPMIEPQDMPVSLRHLYRNRVMIQTTDRAIRDNAHGRVIPEDTVAMMKIAFNGPDNDAPLPGVVTGGTINVTSPLRLDDRMIGGIVSFARHGQATVITPFIMAGATSATPISSALAQQNAEALGGIALSQLANPGSPVIYGGFTQNVDMRSGSPAFGGPEGAWAIIVGGQLARYYGLPYRSSGSLTNSQIPDAQAAYETQWTMWPAMLAHTNVVWHSVGWLDAGLVVSYEKFIIDVESLAMFHHFMNG
ncbi:MAG: trimethylamine methyltransferase family protein, partial [Chloroflexota bacterium]